MSNKLLQTISVFENGIVKLTSLTAEGHKIPITCNLKDYVQYISSSFGSLVTPILPYGCRYYAKKKDKICLIIEKPSFVLPVLSTGSGNIDNITIPGTLWFFDINSNADGLTTSRSYCHTMKMFDNFSLSMGLNHFIFPHYADWYNGICWGDRKSNVATITKDLSGFGRLPDLFFNTTSVNHLIPAGNVIRPFQIVASEHSLPNLLGSTSDYPHKAIYDVLKGAPHLVDSCLTPTGAKVSDLVDTILGNTNGTN